MWVGICKRLLLSLIYVSELALLSVSMSCSVSCTKETVLGLKQVELPSQLQNSEQASRADEQLHICEEHGLSLLQLPLINLSLSEGATSTLLGSQTGQYPPDGPSDAHPNSVDPALVDPVAMQLYKCKLENEPALHSL